MLANTGAGLYSTGDMNPRGLPDGYVLCGKCNKAVPSSKMSTHETTHGTDKAVTVKQPEVVAPPATTTAKATRGPNKTEMAYYNKFLQFKDARYEALTFRMANGSRYTPDWIVFEVGRPVECVEVKGSYRFGSHNRAQLAFAQCKIEFPGLRWTWASRDKKLVGGWNVQR